jgi:hypothetical protein
MPRTELPPRNDPTLDAVESAVESNTTSDVRSYLGWSGLGHPCERSVIYDWLQAQLKTYPAGTLFKFEDGHGTEARINDRFEQLASVDQGLEFLPDGPDGKQWSVEACSGHLKGHLDGVIKGLRQAPGEWHVYEVKCVNEARFRKLRRLVAQHGTDALELWSEQYFIQAQGYMGSAYPQLQHHYLVCVTPGGREMTSCHTKFQPLVFEAAIEKARQLITSTELPPRVSDDPGYFVCRSFCSFQKVCHYGQSAKVNCRTCAHSTPVTNQEGGKWKCEKKDPHLVMAPWETTGCRQHLYRPDMLPWANAIEFNKEQNEITYRTENGTVFANCETANWKQKRFTSKDLFHLDAKAVDTDSLHLDALSVFCPDAEIVSREKAQPPEPPLNDDLPSFL